MFSNYKTPTTREIQNAHVNNILYSIPNSNITLLYISLRFFNGAKSPTWFPYHKCETGLVPSASKSSVTVNKMNFYECCIHSYLCFFLQRKDQQKLIPRENKFLHHLGTALISN
jgi:hypothetical protein